MDREEDRTDSDPAAGDLTARAEAAVGDRARLEALRASGLLDSAPEQVFDRITRLAATVLRVPATFISLVDEDRDFYKSCVGFGEPLATVRQLEGETFCHYAIASPSALVIPDTRADPVYAAVPTVTSLGVAAYLGVPIRTEDGRSLGSLCAIDFSPRQWSATDVEVMTELAASTEREIALRRRAAAHEALNAELQWQQADMRRQVAETAALNATLHTMNEELSTAWQAADVLAAEANAARAEAERANRAKSQFLATMSHEIRTPINAIMGYTDLLRAGITGPLAPQQEQYLGRIRTSSQHLLRLIDEVLDFSKIEAGELRIAREPTPLQSVIAPAMQMVWPQAEARGVRLERESEVDEGLEFMGDEERVRQILLNLLSNAVRFTARGGMVLLRLREVGRATLDNPAPDAGPWVAVEVEDTGVGIAAEEQDRVFEPFVQAEAGLTRTAGGTGLGLSIARQLARLMGGDITLRSVKDVGSRFTLWLPASS